MNVKKRILAIDYGTKYIGLAITDDDNTFSVPYSVEENTNNFFDKLIEIIYEENIGIIVIGYPTTFDGYVSARHKLINDFVDNINSKVSNLEIVLQDEAYTTKSSEYIQREFGLRNSQIKKTKDMSSAALILDAYLKMISTKK